MKEFTDASTDHFHNKNTRYGFRCNYHYADNSCYGGPDGGGCPTGRRRRSVTRIEKSLNKKKGFLVAAGGECGRGYQAITGIEKCKEAAAILNISLQLQRDNTRNITGCIATQDSNTTNEKAICESVSKRMGGMGRSARVKAKRTKRQVYNTRTFTCTDWVQNRAYWVWEHEVPSTCTSE